MARRTGGMRGQAKSAAKRAANRIRGKGSQIANLTKQNRIYTPGEINKMFATNRGQYNKIMKSGGFMGYRTNRRTGVQEAYTG